MNTEQKEKSQVRLYNPDEQTDATGRLQDFLKLSSEFDATKKCLNRMGNYFVNILFSLLGYQYEGRNGTDNILDISAEAWLLGVFHQLQKEELEKVSYFNLLTQIKQSIVEENTFIDNMRLLIGVYGLTEPSFKDADLYKSFLLNIENAKNQMAIEEVNMTKSKFEHILLATLRTAFDVTLNELYSKEDKIKTLNLLDFYNKSKNDIKPLVFDIFHHKYLEENKIGKELPDSKLFYILSSFYNFCEVNFEDLLGEINLFNQHAGSVLFKIKNILSIKNTMKMYKLASEIMEKGMKNLRLDSVVKFYRNVVLQVQPYKEQALTKVKNSYATGKEWLGSTIVRYEEMADPILKQFNQYKHFVIEKTLMYSKVPTELIFERVYIPLKTVTLNVKDSSVNLVLSTVELGKEKTEKLRIYIVEKVSQTVEGIKSSFIGENPLVKIQYNAEDNNNYMSISISKKLFLIDPTKAADLVKGILEKIRNFDVVDTSRKAISYTQERVSDAKTYIISSYKKFLDLASEDESEGESVKNEVSHDKSE